MWNWLKQILSPPVFEDENQNRVARILNIILLTILVVAFFIPVAQLIMGVEQAELIFSAGLSAFWIVLLLVLLWLLHRGYLKLPGLLIPLLMLGMYTFLLLREDVPDTIFIGYATVIIMAGLLLGKRAIIVFAFLCVGALLGVFFIERGSTGVEVSLLSRPEALVTIIANLGMITVLYYVAINSLTNSLKRVQDQKQEAAIFRALAENATDGIFMAASTGEVTYANRAGYELLGRDYEQKEIGDLDFSGLIPAAEESEQSDGDTLLSSLQAGNRQSELQQRRQDGSLVDVHSTAFVIQDEVKEEAVALAAIVRDITEQKQTELERQQLQLEIIDAQREALKELSVPIIPITDQVIVMPLVGSIDTLRARDITRALLTGISQHQAKVVIVDITGVAVVDTGVVNYLNKTIQAARLKGARTIVTGISDAVAETIVELGIDWSNIETLRDLQTGLGAALDSLSIKFAK